MSETLENTSFAEGFQACRDALKAFNGRELDEQHEAIVDDPLCVETLAHAVRQHVPADDSTPIRMTAAQKDFWNRFIAELGPDYEEGLRICVAFGRKAQEF